MKRWQRTIKLSGAACGVLAGILLFFSFTSTSSTFKPILTTDGAHLCFNGKLLVAGYGGPLVLSQEACPGWNEGKSAALVSAEHPIFMLLGFILLGLSFVLQTIDILSS